MRIAVAIAGTLIGVALQSWAGVEGAAFIGFLLSVVAAAFIPNKSGSCSARR